MANISNQSINTLFFNTGPAEYYTDAFRQVLEDHMAWLRNNQSTQTIQVSAQAVWENEGDLFGFLQTINIPPQLHWVTMRLNNFNSPFQFNRTVTQLLIPSLMVTEQLRSAYLTSSTIGS
jgi:hypothetical protein